MNGGLCIPVLVIVVASNPTVGDDGAPTNASMVADDFFKGVMAELARVGQRENLIEYLDVVAAVYHDEESVENLPVGELKCIRAPLQQEPDQVGGGSTQKVACASFPNLEASLTALGNWMLKREESNSPVLVVHVTLGRFKCCGEVEREAGILKVVCDLRGASSVFYNVLVTNDGGGVFPLPEEVVKNPYPVVKTLYRMSSPVGNRGAELLTQAGLAGAGGSRYFEPVPSVATSVATRFAGVFFADAVKAVNVSLKECLLVHVFLKPKKSERLDNCEDVVSAARDLRRFVIADGATTASYSAEWARALCRQAMDTPPPVFADFDGTTEGSRTKEDEELLRAWWEGALNFFGPEVPWERLTRPSMFNKAKAGTGATHAGIEVLDGTESAGVRYRAWALGDSCIIQFRDNQVLTSRPMAKSDHFSHVPMLLMTQPGLVDTYLRHWQNWEATLAPGDLLLMGTDALSEYILKTFENGKGEEVLAWLRDLQSASRAEGWRKFEEFVEARRSDGQMKDDDVGLILIELKQNGSRA